MKLKADNLPFGVLTGSVAPLLFLLQKRGQPLHSLEHILGSRAASLPPSFLLRSPDRLSDSPSGETCEGSCRFRHLFHCRRRRAALVAPCNFLILSAALAGLDGCGARPSLPDSCGKTQVRLWGHSKVFSALELRGKSITVKES